MDGIMNYIGSPYSAVLTCSCRVRQQRNPCECRAALHTLVVASLPQATGDMESQLPDADS